MSGRGRPASVDVDQNSLQETQTISSNIQIHSIGRRGSNQGKSFYYFSTRNPNSLPNLNCMKSFPLPFIY